MSAPVPLASEAAVKARPFAGCITELPDTFTPPAPQEYLIGRPGRGFLPAHLGAALVGPGAVGKSQFAVQMAVALALGRPFLGHEVEQPRSTVFLSGEDDGDDYVRKVFSVAEALGLGPAQWTELRRRITIMDVAGKGAVFVDGKGGRFAPGAAVESVAAAIGEYCQEPDLIVVDTLSTALGTNEDAGPIAAFWQAMAKLSGRFDSKPATLVAHHVSKENASRGSVGQDVGRGSSVFGNNARTVIAMARVTRDNVPTVKRVLGCDVPDEARPELRLVQAVKVKGSRPGPPLVVETLSAPSNLGFAFRPYVLPIESTAKAEEELRQRALAFRDLVIRVAADTGKPVTTNALQAAGAGSRDVLKAGLDLALKAGLVTEEVKGRSRVIVPMPHEPGQADEELNVAGQEAA